MFLLYSVLQLSVEGHSVVNTFRTQGIPLGLVTFGGSGGIQSSQEYRQPIARNKQQAPDDQYHSTRHSIQTMRSGDV